jgi:hypothetical protein
MRFKILCPVLSVFLCMQITVLWGIDGIAIAPGSRMIETGESSFYGHLLLHDYRQYGIPDYQPYQGTEGMLLRKDPFIAGLLSWFMKGVGQIYVHEYWKGSLFIAADLTNKVLLILLINHINQTYGSSDEVVNVDWGSFGAGTKILIIGYLVEALGIRIFSVVDAVQSAHRYNERFTDSRSEKGYSFEINGEDLSLGYYYRFND